MAQKSKNDPRAVDAYLATLPRPERKALARLRSLVKKTVPQVEERISYGTTVMFSLGRDLVGFVSQPRHLSFFTASPEVGPDDEGRVDEDAQGQRCHDSFLARQSTVGSAREEDPQGTRS
jgi:hypothetical protein